MGGKSQKLLEKWISIPRWIRNSVPMLITLAVIFMAIFKGIEMLMHPTSLSISLSDIIICLIPTIILTIVINKNIKK